MGRLSTLADMQLRDPAEGLVDVKAKRDRSLAEAGRMIGEISIAQKEEEIKKTGGGALASASSGAVAGMSVAGATELFSVAAGGWMGAAVGLASYMFG